MKMGMARALLLATAGLLSCGVGCGKGGASTGGDAGPHGPTSIVATWTLAGKAASASTCMGHGAAQIYVNLSGTIDPSLHQSMTIDCSKGSVSFDNLLVEKLGMPYLEGTLLDAKGVAVDLVGVTVAPVPGMTNVSLAFFAPQNAGGGGMGGMSSSQAASSSSTGGMGGKGSSSSSSGGTGGAAASSSSSSGGMMDAGGGG